MSVTLTARRALTGAATMALLAAAPGLTGVASASDHRGESHGESTCSASQLSLSIEQQNGVDAATAAYVTSVRSAKNALRTATAAIRDTVMTDPAVLSTRASLLMAHDAYEAADNTATEPALKVAYENAKKAFQDAVQAARGANQASIDGAVTTYRTAVAAADTAYTTALTTVFGTAAAIPAQLVNPHGRDAHGHHGSDGRDGHGMRSNDDRFGSLTSSAYVDCDDDDDNDGSDD